MNQKNLVKTLIMNGLRVEKLPSSGVNLSHPEQVFFLTKTWFISSLIYIYWN